MVNYSLSVLLFFAVPSLCAQSSTGTEHWVTFMENLDLQFNQPPSFHIVVSSEYPAVGQLEFPSTGFTIPFTVSGGTEVVIDLPTNSYYADGDEATFDHGMRIIVAFHHKAHSQIVRFQFIVTTVLHGNHGRNQLGHLSFHFTGLRIFRIIHRNLSRFSQTFR